MDNDAVLIGQQIMLQLRRDGQWVARAWYSRDGEDPTPPSSIYVQVPGRASVQQPRPPSFEVVFELAGSQPESGDWAYDEVHRRVSAGDAFARLMAGSLLEPS